MMNMDITALGAAPAPPDTGCGSAETPDAASAFAALLDEAAGATDESIEPSPVCERDVAADDEFDELAALTMTSLLSLPAPVMPAEAIQEDAVADIGEIGDAEPIGAVTTTPDGVSDVNADAEGNQAEAVAADADPSTVPEWTAKVRTASAGEAAPVESVTPDHAGAVNAQSPTPESAKTANADVPRTEGAHAAAATLETRAMKTPRGATSARTDDSPKTAATRQADPIAQAVAAAAGSPNADPRVTGRDNTTEPQAPSSTAARLARALERAAAVVTGDSATVQVPTGTGGASDQPSSFGGDESADRNAQTFPAPRHANGALSFTVAAASSLDLRTLARAVDAAGLSFDAPAGAIPERDVVAQLVQSMRVQFRDGIGEAVVKLKPEHLGSVQISLKIEHGAIKATVQAEMPAVRQWLESQQDMLRTGLAEQGLRLERFVVEPDGERQTARDDAQPREERRRRHQRRMSVKDHPVFEVTV
jgi:flagellar hook-length control protein FliK